MKCPAQKLIDSFRLDMIGNDRVEDYLRNNWSLVICCKTCTRVIGWTPKDIHDRFGDRPQTKIANIAARLKCTGECACASDEVAVFPHLT